MTPQFIILHHSITPRDQKPDRAELGINRTHKKRGFPKSSLGWYIGYQYIIFGTGEIRQYRKNTEVGAHCKEKSMNFKSIGICLCGNFDIELPTEKQELSLKELLEKLTFKYNILIKNVVPHRHFAKNFWGKPYKTCYGSMLSDEWAKNLLNNNIMVDKKKLSQIFNELLMRNYDSSALSYLGKEEEFVRKEVGKSFERQLIITHINHARELK